MKQLEAIDWCNQFQDNLIKTPGIEYERFALALKATQTAKAAIEKQIHRKPIAHKVEVDMVRIGNAVWRKGTTAYKCPRCRNMISRLYDYCFKCGQALDWGK